MEIYISSCLFVAAVQKQRRLFVITFLHLRRQPISAQLMPVVEKMLKENFLTKHKN